MSRLSIFLIIILVISSYHEPCSANPFLTAKQAFDFARNLYGKITAIQKAINAGNADHGIENRIDSNLLKLSTDFQEFKMEIMKKISTSLYTKLDVKTDRLFQYAKDIQRQYAEMIDIISEYENYPASYLENFAHVTTTLSLGELKRKIEQMHETFAQGDFKNKSIINIISKDSTAGDTMCVKAHSSQQVLNELFQLVVQNDAKGLLTTLYAHDLMNKLDNETSSDKYNFLKEKEIENYNARVSSSYKAVKQALVTASREIWRCDPETHQPGVTYSKPFDVFQKYVHREQDTLLSLKELSIQECRSQKMEKELCRSYDCWSLPKHRRCTGKLRDCDRLGRNHDICFAPPNDKRKYQSMKVGNTNYGRRHETCNQDKKQLNELIPIYDPLSVCFCTCEAGDIEVDRYFSLFESTSDIEENKVVTGVKIIIENNVYQLEVQQGTLGAEAEILGELKWKQNHSVPPQLVNTIARSFVKVIETERENLERVRKQVEYTDFLRNEMLYTITYEQSTIYLDDVQLPQGYLVTGVKFAQVGDDLRLEVRGTPFDYASGKLDRDASEWFYNKKTKNQRQEVQLIGADDPLRFSASDIFSMDGEYVKFTTTDARADLGQNTIPFIDVQEVITTPQIPLTGAGLFHKKSKLSGGFLALKIFHYDFSPYM